MYQQKKEIGGSISEHFNNGVRIFIDFSLSNNENDEEIHCPCNKCKLLKYLPRTVRVHLH